jgi:iron complex outermembrane recepter protein
MKKNVHRLLVMAALLLTMTTVYAQTRLVTGTVTDKNGPLIGASVLVKGTEVGNQTDAEGKFSINAPASAAMLVISYAGYGTQEVEIPVSNVVTVELVTSVNELAEVVISVGSRTSQRTITDSPIPIDVISARDLRSTGQMTFDKALQYRVPSFNTVNTPVNDATSLLDPYEIRNMGPSRTLVLINGKRKNLSSLVYIQTSPGRGETGADISAIPLDAIKRIEVLRDGASAQYGSDAIAGVMNIILKDRFEYGSLTLNTGITQNTGPLGKKFDGQSYGVTLNNGANFGEKGYLNYTISLMNSALANRPGVVDAQGDANDFGASLTTVQNFLQKFPDAGNINGQPATAAAKFVVNGGIPLDANTEFYYNAAYTYKKVNSFANYRTPYWRPTDFGLLTPAGQTYVGYVPTFEGDLNDYNGTVGFRSTSKSGWKSDVSFTTGGNRQLYTVSNSVNRGLGKNSPILFKPGGYSFSHNVGNIDVSKALTKKLNFAVGAEFRSEKFEIVAGDTASSKTAPGADSFPGIGSNNAGTFTRYNFGGYVDLGLDVTKNFLINGTLRTEKYSDFGNKTVWKLSSRYKFLNDKATIRASVSTGFRAPTLHQINLQIAQASFVPGQGIQTKGIVNNRSAQAKLLGVPQLKPEESTNFTIGLGLNPSKNFSFSLDYYNIRVKNRIILGSEISGTTSGTTALDKILKDNGIVAVSFFTNGITTSTQGIDLVANYRNISLGKSKLNVNLAGNYQFQNALVGGLAGVTNPILIQQSGGSVFDATQEALLLSSRPKFKAIFGLDYVMSKININLNNTLFGPTTFRQNGLDNNLKTVFQSRLVTDLGASITLTKSLNLGLNIQNLFNVLPKWNLKALNSSGETILNNPALVKANVNAITFNGRYSNVTYDGSHFSQLGRLFSAQLILKF